MLKRFKNAVLIGRSAGPKRNRKKQRKLKAFVRHRAKEKCIGNPISTTPVLVHCDEYVLVAVSSVTEFIPQISLIIKSRNKDHLGNGQR